VCVYRDPRGFERDQALKRRISSLKRKSANDPSIEPKKYVRAFQVLVTLGPFPPSSGRSKSRGLVILVIIIKLLHAEAKSEAVAALVLPIPFDMRLPLLLVLLRGCIRILVRKGCEAGGIEHHSAVARVGEERLLRYRDERVRRDDDAGDSASLRSDEVALWRENVN
jgi:hypothetical protein